MRRALALLLLATLMSCSRGAQVVLIPDKDLPSDLYGGNERPSTEPRTIRTLVYFVGTDAKGQLLVPERLGSATREEKANRTAAEQAMQVLLDGPTAAEQERGLRTAVPVGTVLLGVSITDGVADVNLTAQFEAAGAEVLHLLRIAQIVWTLTELPEVDAVSFRIHGAPQPVIDQLGVAHDVVGRGRYSGLAPRDEGGPDVAPEPESPAPQSTSAAP